MPETTDVLQEGLRAVKHEPPAFQTTRKIIRLGSGEYFMDEDGGAYCFIRSRKHAMRLTDAEAERLASILRHSYQGVEIEIA